jgi:hypothetical protein
VGGMSEKDEEIAALTLSCVRELLSKRVRHPFGILFDTTTPHTLPCRYTQHIPSFFVCLDSSVRPGSPPSRLPLDGSSLMICKGNGDGRVWGAVLHSGVWYYGGHAVGLVL